MSATWTKLSIRVASRTLDAARIAQEIGLAPTRVAERGQPVSPRSSAVHEQAACFYESPLSDASPIEEHMAWLVELLEAKRTQVSAVAPECEFDVRLGFSSTSGQGGFALTGAELGLLGSLGVQLNIDLYPPDEDEGDDEPDSA